MQSAKPRHLNSEAAFKREMPPTNCAGGGGGLEGNDVILPLSFVCRTCVGDYADALHPHMDRSAEAQLCGPPVLGLI